MTRRRHPQRIVGPWRAAKDWGKAEKRCLNEVNRRARRLAKRLIRSGVDH